MFLRLNVFHWGSAYVDYGPDGVDEQGRVAGARTDLAEDLPGLELHVRPLARAF